MDVGKADKSQKVVELAKKRGFFWQSYEIYGGESGFIDYGPLGALLKRKIENKWIDVFVKEEGLMLIDTPIITPATVFEASGHTTHFTDPITTCLKCGRKWRADHLLEEATETSFEGLTIEELRLKMREINVKCPQCKGDLEDPKPFNELFKTTIGPYTENVGYGRPETAQGIFVNFKRLYEIARGKLPLGVAQIGRCVRNEISPRQGPIRLRELTIMEFEFFYDPENPKCWKLSNVKNEVLRLLPEEVLVKGGKQPLEISVEEALDKGYIKSEWMAYFMVKAKKFVEELGIPAEKQIFREKLPSERAHYSSQTYDQLVELSRWGWVEVSGHALRLNYDLKMHMVYSGEDLRVYVPYSSPLKTRKVILEVRKDVVTKSFGDDASKILRFLSLTDADEVAESVSKLGYYELKCDGKTYRITTNHVEFKEIDVEEKGRRFLPYVAEPSFGLDRLLYATLEYGYSEKEGRVVLKLPKDLAPIETAVFPLMSKDRLPEKALEVYNMLVKEGFIVEYDESGSIGRRYARMDEVGTPFAITIDYQTLNDDTVTIRDRDSWRQVRVKIESLPETLRKLLKGKLNFENLA
ncbi:MAG: glycine--tRNA ligase [Candidatus Bathyarchaeota archaeon]